MPNEELYDATVLAVRQMMGYVQPPQLVSMDEELWEELGQPAAIAGCAVSTSPFAKGNIYVYCGAPFAEDSIPQPGTNFNLFRFLGD